MNQLTFDLLVEVPLPKCVIPVCDFGAEVWWKGQSTYQQKFETVQNTALRCILGAFRTSPTISLHNEAALPSVAVRLNHMRRKYAIRILTFPEMHPIRQRCPSTFPPFYESPESSNTSGPWIPWDSMEQNNRKFETRLIETLSTLSPWISNSSEIETYSTTACPPWIESRVKTHISPLSKEKEAKAHEAQYAMLKNDNRNIVCYTDGSMLKENIGAGTVVEMTGEEVMEATYPMGHQQEV